jgi:hypothetical protein
MSRAFTASSTQQGGSTPCGRHSNSTGLGSSPCGGRTKVSSSSEPARSKYPADQPPSSVVTCDGSPPLGWTTSTTSQSASRVPNGTLTRSTPSFPVRSVTRNVCATSSPILRVSAVYLGRHRWEQQDGPIHDPMPNDRPIAGDRISLRLLPCLFSLRPTLRAAIVVIIFRVVVTSMPIITNDYKSAGLNCKWGRNDQRQK